MGRAKSGDKVTKSYALTDNEFNYLKLLNLALQFNELKNKLISGYLYYVANQRLGYKSGVNLVFEVDLEDEDKKEVKIKEIPNELIDKAVNKPG